jgi:mRNA-degrading endonuclease HigB of HigAB toxin-antitoxin module
MTVNNIELIKDLLEFRTDDDFYMVQIIKRKKEHPELGSNNHMVKAYYISSVEELDKHFPEMVVLADFHRARVMINLNRRSFEKIAFQNLKKLSDQIMNKEYRSAKKAYNTVAGQFNNEKDKKWIIDIDTKDMGTVAAVSDGIMDIYTKMDTNGKIHAVIPTKNGYHVIVSPFNVMWFNTDLGYLNLDLHKDNPTIIYC